MAQASPPAAECAICSEEVSSMKILPCDHRFCLTCLNRISQGRPSIDCPNCRKTHPVPSTERLSTVYFGRLKCGSCQEYWDSDRCYWCPICVQIICPTCRIEEHSGKQHQVYRWNSLQGVKDCYSHSLRISQLQSVNEVSPEGIRKIKDMCQNIQELLIQKLKQIDPLVPFHDLLNQMFGQVDISSSNPLTSNADRLEGISQEIVSLATKEDPLELPEHTLSHGGPTRMTVDRFTKSADFFATMIWNDMELKKEVLPITVPSAPPLELDDMVIDGHFVCSVPFLASICEVFSLPDTVPNFKIWRYVGNGTDFQKFLSIVEKNKNRSTDVVIDCAEEFLPTAILRLAVVDSITVRIPCEMGEQSQNLLYNFLFSLLRHVPKLRIFALDTAGNANETLDIVWRYLPASVTWIGASAIPLTQRGIKIIANKMKQTMNGIEISYDSRSWESMLSLVSEIICRRARPNLALWICDCIGDAVIFGKFMQEIKQYNGNMTLCLNNFTLMEAQAEELLKILETSNGLQSLILSRMEVNDSIMWQIIAVCRTRHINIF